MHQSPLEKEKLLMARLCWKAVSKSKMQILLLLFERSTHSAFLIRIANKVVKRCKFNSFVESFFCTFFCNFGGKGLNCRSSLSSDRRLLDALVDATLPVIGCNVPVDGCKRYRCGMWSRFHSSRFYIKRVPTNSVGAMFS